MRKQGKPNTFFKGMKTDMSAAAHPKDSYRYAKNIRLLSFEGKNVAIQPYDSDRLTLTLSGEISESDIVVPPKNMLSALVEDVLANSDAGSSLFTTQGFFDWAAGQDWVDSNDYGFNIQNLFDGMDVDATGFPEETTNYFMNEDNSEQNVQIQGSCINDD